MEKIYAYDNYRIFLRDYMDKQRNANRKFSLRFFAMKAGFKSHSFLDNVVQGKRNLTLESTRKIVKAFGLERKEALFFQSLVLYNQSKTPREREENFRELAKIRRSIQFYRVQESQFAYYSKWYLPVLRELAVYSDWGRDYQRLGQMVRPPLSADIARAGIRTLVEIGLLKDEGRGNFSQTEKVVTAEGVPGYIFKNARTEYMLRAMEAAENLPKEERHIAYSVMAMSRKTFQEITNLLDEERKRMLVMANDDKQVDDIFVLNIQAFPITQNINSPHLVEKLK